MILMIDNYDSFTYNLVRYCEELGVKTHVVQNDQISLADIEKLNPQAILLSPGPGSPSESGLCLDVVRFFGEKLPILGICLGHQVICQSYGGTVGRAKQVVHGKTSQLFHRDTGLFAGLPQGYNVARYHSLVAKIDSLPDCLEIVAWTLDESQCFDEIMGLKHRTFAVFGVQFHPEALLTDHGHRLLAAFFQSFGLTIHQSVVNYSEIKNYSELKDEGVKT